MRTAIDLIIEVPVIVEVPVSLPAGTYASCTVTVPGERYPPKPPIDDGFDPGQVLELLP